MNSLFIFLIDLLNLKMMTKFLTLFWQILLIKLEIKVNPNYDKKKYLN